MPIPKEPLMFATLSEALSTLLQLDPSNSDTDALIENGPGACYVIEADSYRVRYLSKKAFDFMPQSFNTLIAERESWAALICDEDRPHYKTALEKLGEEGGEAMIVYRIETSKKSDWIPAKDFVTPLYNKSRELVGFMGRITDDSFRIQSMDTLVKRSWKEVATTVTRRFLHDFNNMIAGIFSLSELYSTPGSDAETMMEAMAHIRDSSIRAQKITQKIRSLSAMNDGEESYFDLGKLIEEQEEYLLAILPKTVDLTFDLNDESLPARLDANRFRQALLHLASNANDATDDHPKVSIHCASEKPTDDGEPPQFATIVFTDDGQGIAARNLPKIAEPFFTTKDPKNHVGMGLFIVKQFVRELGGDMAVESVPGEGTTVTLRMPLANLSETFPDANATYAGDTAPPIAQPKKARTILIYTWEDITRHPLINAIRAANWKYRIHLDPDQLELDLRDLEDDLDGVLVFKSALDEKVDQLILATAERDSPPKLAVIALGESVDAVDESIKTKCGFLASGSKKPGTLLKKLNQYFG